MRRRLFCCAVFAAALMASPATAEELWLISAGDEFAYFIDADSAVFACGDDAVRRDVAQRMNGDATLDEAVTIARNVGAERQP